MAEWITPNSSVTKGGGDATMYGMSAAVRIAVVGDFNPDYPTHHAINAALGHAADDLAVRMDSKWVATACAARDAARVLRGYDLNPA